MFSMSACTARPMRSPWQRRASSSGATARPSTRGGSPAGLRATENAARAAAERVAERLGVALLSIEFERAARRSVTPRSSRHRAAAARSRRRARQRTAGSRHSRSRIAEEGFRLADVRGLDSAGAVVAAAQAQLGWPYIWGGESREEGGFDCSGLVDYAFNAAGYQVGRPVAAGFQQMSAPVPLRDDALRPGDLLFVGAPAHHVGLVAAPGIAIEAPHRGARVRYERIADGGWTSAGPAACARRRFRPSRREPAATCRRGFPPDWRALIGEAARRESLPPALLAAQIEAESGFDAARRLARGRARASRSSCPPPGPGVEPVPRAQPVRAALRAAGARYLRRLLDQTGGDVPRALAAYNAGLAGSAGAWPAETRAYVARIMRRFGGAHVAWGARHAQPERSTASTGAAPAAAQVAC